LKIFDTKTSFEKELIRVFEHPQNFWAVQKKEEFSFWKKILTVHSLD